MERLVFETRLGHTAIARQNLRVLGISFGHKSQRAAIRALSKTMATRSESPKLLGLGAVDHVPAGQDELIDRVCRFADGIPTAFGDVSIDSSHLTQFGQSVIAVCRRIPWGETRTYGQLAKEAGRPGAARAVGSVMARNRFPLIVPCHRVVAAGGKLGGFSAPQGVSMKERLLEAEQITDETNLA